MAFSTLSGQWTLPNDPYWSERDGNEIRQFHNKHVKVNASEFSFNAHHADRFLEHLYPRLKTESGSYPWIILKEFIRQVSSREGLKVSNADEFDVVLPFEFLGVTTRVLAKNEPQFNPLPPGYAQIDLVTVSDDFRRQYPKLIKRVGRKEMLDTKYLHDTIFKGMVDKMLSNLGGDSSLRASVVYCVLRKSNAPAIRMFWVTVYRAGSGYYICLKSRDFPQKFHRPTSGLDAIHISAD